MYFGEAKGGAGHQLESTGISLVASTQNGPRQPIQGVSGVAIGLQGSSQNTRSEQAIYQSGSFLDQFAQATTFPQPFQQLFPQDRQLDQTVPDSPPAVIFDTVSASSNEALRVNAANLAKVATRRHQVELAVRVEPSARLLHDGLDEKARKDLHGFHEANLKAHGELADGVRGGGLYPVTRLEQGKRFARLNARTKKFTGTRQTVSGSAASSINKPNNKPNKHNSKPNPGNRFRRALIALAGTTLMITGLPLITGPAGAALRTFTNRFNTNAQGDIVFVGNTLMSCTNPLNSDCSGAQAGTNTGSQLNNNNMNMRMVDVDGVATTFNSSSAVYSVPTGSTVLFAGLYWGAKISAGSGAGAVAAITPAARNAVQFKVPGSSAYTTVTASVVDDDPSATAYQGFADVTTKVASAGTGTYTVANVQAGTGADRYAGWSLVIAYADPNATLKNLVVFDGLQTVSSGPIVIPVSGFLTPPAGAINSKLGVIAYEGDSGTTGDQLSFKDTSPALSTLPSFTLLGDAGVTGTNPAANFFNSTLSNQGVRDTTGGPGYVNTLGYDADIIKLPVGALRNNATSANIQMSSTGDVYYPGVVTLTTELFAPKMKTTKTASVPEGTVLKPGDIITYTLVAENSGDDPAFDVVLTDPLPANLSYVAGTMKITDGLNGSASFKTDAADGDGAKFTAGVSGGPGVLEFSGLAKSVVPKGSPAVNYNVLAKNEKVTVTFQARVEETAPDVTPLPNTASLAYKALTLGSASTSSSTTHTVVIENKVDLSVTKTDNSPDEVPGTPISYTIVVRNNSATTPVEGAAVSDPTVSGLINMSWTCSVSTVAVGNACPASGTGPIATTVDLKPGATATFIYSGTIDQSLLGSLTNTVTVTAPVGVTDSVPGNNFAADFDTLARTADLTITKTNGRLVSTAGSSVTYTVVAKNLGPSAVTAATVTDTLPLVKPGTTPTWTCVASSGSVCPAALGPVNLSASVDLLVNGTATFTATYLVDPAATPTSISATSKLSNTARVIVPAGTTDPVPVANNAADDVDDIVSENDLSVTKTHTGSLIPGTVANYTITVNNAGPSFAPSATLTDVLPVGLSPIAAVSSVWTCPAAAAQTFTCTAANLPVGTSTVIITAMIDPGFTGQLVNPANVSSPTDTTTTNNSSTDSTTVGPLADLAVSKSHQPAVVVAGTQMTYVLGATNNGPSDAAQVLVTDTLPAGVTFVSGAGCSLVLLQVKCTKPVLGVGASATFEVIVDIASNPALGAGGLPAALVNTAAVSSATPEPTTPAAVANNTAIDTVTPLLQGDVQITKIHPGVQDPLLPPNVIVAGQPMTYIVTVKNFGPSAVTGLLVNDTLPPVFVGGTVTWTCVATNGTCTNGSGVNGLVNESVNLASGGVATFTIIGTLQSSALGSFLNTATVTTPPGFTDPNSANNTANDPSEVVARADLSIVKSNGVAQLIPGLPTSYTIIVGNAGPSSSNGTTVTDAASAAGLTGVTWSCVASSGSGCPAAGLGDLSTSAVNLLPGGSAVFTLTGTVSPTARGTLANTATVTTPASVLESASQKANNTSTDTDALSTISDLSITKTASPSPAVPGSPITYVVKVRNAGPSSVAAGEVTDMLPPELVVGSATWFCTVAPVSSGSSCAAPSGTGSIIGSNIDLLPGATATFTVNATIDQFASGVLSNSASVLPPAGTDPTVGDLSASVDVPLAPVADLQISKVRSPDPLATVVPGSALAYKITATNNGPSGARGVLISDILPSAVTNVSWTCVLGAVGYTASSCLTSSSGVGDINATVDLASGQSLVFTVTADVLQTATGLLDNTATIAGPSTVGDPIASNNTSTDSTPLVPKAALTLSKIVKIPASGANAVAGEAIQYEIVVKNLGPSAAPNTLISDAVPSSILGATWTSVCGLATPLTTVANCAGSTGLGSIASSVHLMKDQTITFTVDGTIDSGFLDPSILNTASAELDGSVTNLNTGPTTSDATVAVDRKADLLVSKTNGVGVFTLVPGEATSYTIVVQNAGPSTLFGVPVNDPGNVLLLNPTWSCGASAGSSCANGGGTGAIATTVTLLPGGKATFVHQALVDANALPGVLTNTVTATMPGGVIDTDPLTNGVADDSDTLTPTSNLSITKTDGVSLAIPGQRASYSIKVTNAGPSRVVNATVADVAGALGAGLDNPEWRCTDGSCPSPASGLGDLKALVTLLPGATASFTVAGDIPGGLTGSVGFPGSLVNKATISAPTGWIDPDLTDNSASDTDALTPKADISVDKTDGQLTAVPGTAIQYSIQVANNGPSANNNISVNDPLSSDLTGVTWSCVYSSGSACGSGSGPIVGAIIALNDADLATFTVLGTIKADARTVVNANPALAHTLRNTATASSVGPSPVADPDPTNNSSTDTSELTPQVDLSITKTDSALTIVPGQSTTYDLVVRNAGPSSVVDAVVLDTVSAQFGNVAWSCAATLPAAACGNDAATDSGTGSLNTTVDLAPGANARFTITADVLSDIVTAMPTPALANTATISVPATGYTELNSLNNSATDTSALKPESDLEVTKTHAPAVLVPGGPVRYVVTVKNNGRSSVSGVAVSDPLPTSIGAATWSCVTSNLARVSYSACQGPQPMSGGGSLDNVRIDLAVGEVATFTIEGTIDSTKRGTLTNTAGAQLPVGWVDPTPDLSPTAVPGLTTATDSTVLAAKADLAITKVNGADEVIPGGSTTWTIAVTNNGPSAVIDALVKDSLPPSVTGATWTCAPVTVPISVIDTCADLLGVGDIDTKVSLAPGHAIEFVVIAQVDPTVTGDIANTATVTAPIDVLDEVVGNDSTTDTDLLTPQVDLGITKVASLASPIPGLPISYTIVVSNTGPSAVVGASVTDTLPAEIIDAAWTCSNLTGGTCGAVSGNGDLGTTADLEVGGSVSYVVMGTLVPTATGTLSNTATVAAPSGYLVLSSKNDSATDSRDVVPTADLSVLKSHVGDITPGLPVTWKIVVANAGPSTVTGASVLDTLPGAISGATWTCVGAGGGTCGAANGIGNLDTTVSLPKNGTATYTVTGLVASGASGDVENTASILVPSGVYDPEPLNNIKTDGAPTAPQSDLRITKTHSPANPVPGEVMTYEIRVVNDGPSAVIGAQITDAIPTVLSAVTWSCSALAIGTAPAGSCVVPSGSGSITDVVNLPVGATAIISISGTLDPTAIGVLSNTASVTLPAGWIDPTPGPTSLVTSATDTADLALKADLRVVKTVVTDSIIPGRSIDWTIEVFNDGPSTATGVQVTDPFPTSVSGATWNCIASALNACSVPSGTGNLAVDVTIQPGTSVQFTASALIDPGATGKLANTATAKLPAEITDPTPSTDPSIPAGSTLGGATKTLFPAVDLSITKTDNVTSVVPGTSTSYEIVVRNDGPSAVVGASVLDTLPSVLRNVQWTCTGLGAANSCGSAGGSGSVDTLVTLEVGGEARITVTADVAANARGLLANIATVTAPPGYSEIPILNNSARDTSTLNPQSDLVVTKTHTPPVLVPGSPVRYTMSVTNQGPSSVEAATISDSLPSGLSAGSATWTCSATPTSACSSLTGTGSLSGIPVDISVGDTINFVVDAKIDPAARGTLANTVAAQLPSGWSDPTPGPVGSVIGETAATDSAPLVAKANLQVTKTNGTNTVTAGTSTVWTVTVTNAGPSSVVGASVVDALPAGVLSANWECTVVPAALVGPSGGPLVNSGNACGSASGVGSLETTVSLAPLGVATYVVRARTNPAALGALTNVASVVAPGDVTETDITDNEATDRDALDVIADLSITKVASLSSPIPGMNLTYTIVASNAGPSAVVGAHIDDTLPAFLTNATWTCTASSGSACGASNGTGNLTAVADLSLNGSVTYLVTALVSSSANGQLTNTATVSPPLGAIDPDTSANSATDKRALVPTTDLQITKTHTGAIVPGNPVEWTIVVSNAGPSDVVDAQVLDTLPVSVLDATWSCVPSGTGATCGAVAGAGNLATSVSLVSGTSATFVVSGRVNSTAVGAVENSASVLVPSGLIDLDPLNNVALDATDATPRSNLRMSKTHVPVNPIPGTMMSYSIAVINDGPSAVVGAEVSDVVPAALSGVTWTCEPFVVLGQASGTCAVPSGSGPVGDVLSLPVGAEVRIAVRGLLDPKTVGTLVNTASVKLPTGWIDPSPGTPPGTTTVTDFALLSPQADLRVVKRTITNPVVAGLGVDWTIAVFNDGPSAAQSVTISDLLPSTVSAATWTCSAEAPSSCAGGLALASGSVVGSLLETTASIESGSSVLLTVHASLDPAATGKLVNVATALLPSGTTDPTPSLDPNVPAGSTSGESSADILQRADVRISKTNGVSSVTVGEAIVYTLTIVNDGPSKVTVPVSDLGSSVVVVNSWTCSGASGASCSAANGTGELRDELITLPPGAVATFLVSATITEVAGAVLASNTATVRLPSAVLPLTAPPSPATDSDDLLSMPTTTTTTSTTTTATTTPTTTSAPPTPATSTTTTSTTTALSTSTSTSSSTTVPPITSTTEPRTTTSFVPVATTTTLAVEVVLTTLPLLSSATSTSSTSSTTVSVPDRVFDPVAIETTTTFAGSIADGSTSTRPRVQDVTATSTLAPALTESTSKVALGSTSASRIIGSAPGVISNPTSSSDSTPDSIPLIVPSATKTGGKVGTKKSPKSLSSSPIGKNPKGTKVLPQNAQTGNPAFTGADSGRLVLVGVATVLLGWVITITARRRRGGSRKTR